MYQPLNDLEPKAPRQGAQHILRRCIGAVLATLALAASLIALGGPASAAAPYTSVIVTPSGDLQLEVLQENTRVQIHQISADSFAIWVHEVDPLDISNYVLVDSENAIGVTRNINVRVADRTLLGVGDETTPVTLPGNLRVVDEIGATVSATVLNTVSVHGDLRINTKGQHHLFVRDTDVGDDLIAVSQQSIQVDVSNSFVADRIKVHGATGAEAELDVVEGGNTLIVGGDGPERVYLGDVTLGTTRVKLNGGQDSVVVYGATFDGRFTVRTNDGADEVSLVDVAATELSVLMGSGDDLLSSSGILADRPHRSTYAGGAGNDAGRFERVERIEQFTIQNFETVTIDEAN